MHLRDLQERLGDGEGTRGVLLLFSEHPRDARKTEIMYIGRDGGGEGIELLARE